jgi:hypothetical protein
VTALLDVYAPHRTQRRLRRILPDLGHERGWRRWRHEDVAAMTDSERRRELFAIALATVYLEERDVPAWFRERTAILRRAGRAA